MQLSSLPVFLAQRRSAKDTEPCEDRYENEAKSKQKSENAHTVFSDIAVPGWEQRKHAVFVQRSAAQVA